MPCESVRHFVFGHGSRARIELADISFAIPGEPDVAAGIGHQPVRPGILNLQRVFLESPGFRIDAPNLVLQLLGKPQRAIAAHRRIMRMRPLGWHLPLLDRNLEFSNAGRRRCRGRVVIVLRLKRPGYVARLPCAPKAEKNSTAQEQYAKNRHVSRSH